MDTDMGKKGKRERVRRSSLLKQHFRFQEVVGSFEVQQESKPFKRLKFESTEEIKLPDFSLSNLSSDLSISLNESEEHEIAKPSRNYSSNKKSWEIEKKPSSHIKVLENASTIYTTRHNSSKIPEELLEISKSGILKDITRDEKENVPSRSKEYLEFLPGKKFCKNCNCEAYTTVKLEMPTMPL
jgi:hypothetical protein